MSDSDLRAFGKLGPRRRVAASVPMSSMDARSPEIDMFAAQAEAAWTILSGHYAKRVSDAELDYLFARFVLGLTSPAYAAAEPTVHFAICRALVGLKLPPERARAALHSVPEASEPWVERAYEAVELQGSKMAQALADQQRDRTDHTDAKADAAHRELSSGAKEQVG